MVSSWITQACPKSNYRCLYKRQKQREDHVNAEAVIGVMQPQAKEHLEPPEAGRGREGASPGAFTGTVAQPTP